MEGIGGVAGELSERLLDAVDDPSPHLRAVATTLLIKAVDDPDREAALIEAMVGSDPAAAMIDPLAAAEAGLRLRHGLGDRLRAMAGDHGEAVVARSLRDHLAAQIRRWATTAVDDADNRRRAERFLAWADRPDQLRAAQERGLFAGMDAEELRRLADRRVRAPVTPETALGLWSQVDGWLARLDDALGDQVIAAWERAAT
jgi:hypothetical protein